MKLRKLVTILSVIVVVAGLSGAAFAQKWDTNKPLEDPYDLKAAEVDATKVDVKHVHMGTGIGTLTTYKDHALPQIDQTRSSNWTTHNLNLSGTRYVDMDQINTSNVNKVVPVWNAQLIPYNASSRGFQTCPLVVDGVMYVTGQAGTMIEALNAVTGERIWTFDTHPSVIQDEDIRQLQNRGAAYGDGVVYMGAGTLMLAFDAMTGEPLEGFGTNGASDVVLQILKAKYPDLEFERPAELGYQITAAPQYYDGKLIFGAGYSELNHPGGYVIAIDAKTGALLWKFLTIPQDETDPYWEITKDTWGEIKTGGGMWNTPAIDPDTGTVYFAIANPYVRSFQERADGLRPGLNLFTNSMMALDVNTGEMKWYYQQCHHDLWDFDSSSPVILYDMQAHGRTVKAVGQAQKNGFLYVLNRETGEPVLPILEQPVPTFTPRADTGETVWPTQPHPYSLNGQLVATVPLTPTEVPEELQQYITPHFTVPDSSVTQITSPGLRGGVNFAPTSLSPKTNMLYTAALHVVDARGQARGQIPSRGSVTAFDKDTLDRAWQTIIPAPTQNGTVVTAGNLVFVGGADGFIYGLDALTGDIVWKYYTGAGISAAPMSFMVNGRQYLTIASGGAVYGRRYGSLITTFALFDQ